MKEATGELNMTVVTVVAIAAVGAFFYAFVWPAIQASIQSNTFCATAQWCTVLDDDTLECYADVDGDGTVTRNEGDRVECPNNDTTGGEAA